LLHFLIAAKAPEGIPLYYFAMLLYVCQGLKVGVVSDCTHLTPPNMYKYTARSFLFPALPLAWWRNVKAGGLSAVPFCHPRERGVGEGRCLSVARSSGGGIDCIRCRAAKQKDCT